MATDPSPPPRGALSLYANLLDPSTHSNTSTISSAPVTYNRSAEISPEEDDAAKKQQALAASLRFQPTKRPQQLAAAQKAKAKAIASKFSQPAATAAVATPTAPPLPNEAETGASDAPAATVKSSIAAWTATASDDEAANFYGEKRQRGGRKKRKKHRETQEIVQNWDDIYDPSRPNNYEEYKHSEEKIREVREWKDLLYRHRMKRRGSSDYDSDESDRRPLNRNFAPPRSFAPPPNLNDDHPPGPSSPPPLSPPPPPPAEIPNDATGEDAYTRRMRMAQQNTYPPPPPLPPQAGATPPPPGQITRAPVRYNLPPPPDELPSTEAELEAKLAQDYDENFEEDDDEDSTDAGTSAAGGEMSTPPSRSNRPGQAGFAQRLLSKYGWTKGSGLGAQGTGIINPLYAKADKRKKTKQKNPDAEGGEGGTPPATGRIMGGQKSKAGRQAEAEGGKFGTMSEVVRLEGMLKGMDLDAELTGRADGGGGIMQEIGEECEEKYGSVVRVYIHRQPEEDPDDDVDRTREGDSGGRGGLVFVAFVSQLSALRAVNALQGRVFNGNVIQARFWPKEKFDQGIYT